MSYGKTTTNLLSISSYIQYSVLKFRQYLTARYPTRLGGFVEHVDLEALRVVVVVVEQYN